MFFVFEVWSIMEGLVLGLVVGLLFGFGTLWFVFCRFFVFCFVFLVGSCVWFFILGLDKILIFFFIGIICLILLITVLILIKFIGILRRVDNCWGGNNVCRYLFK